MANGAGAAGPVSHIVDLGGYQVRYIEHGPSGDEPAEATVLYFHGAGDLSAGWGLVLDALADGGGPAVRSLAIDEPGAGLSTFGPLAHTLAQQAFDTARALDAEKIAGPFVLVGQSRGGLVALEFARRYSERIRAVVLVDSSHPDMLLRYRQDDGSFRWQRVRERAESSDVPAPVSAPVPEGRPARTMPARSIFEAADIERFSAPYRALFAALDGAEIEIPEGLRTHFPAELRRMHESWESYRLGDRPLVVLAAGEVSKQPDDRWTDEALVADSRRLRQDLATLSRCADFRVVEEASHAIHFDRPDAVAEAIRNAVRASRVEEKSGSATCVLDQMPSPAG